MAEVHPQEPPKWHDDAAEQVTYPSLEAMSVPTGTFKPRMLKSNGSTHSLFAEKYSCQLTAQSHCPACIVCKFACTFCSMHVSQAYKSFSLSKVSKHVDTCSHVDCP